MKSLPKLVGIFVIVFALVYGFAVLIYGGIPVSFNKGKSYERQCPAENSAEWSQV